MEISPLTGGIQSLAAPGLITGVPHQTNGLPPLADRRGPIIRRSRIGDLRFFSITPGTYGRGTHCSAVAQSVDRIIVMGSYRLNRRRLDGTRHGRTAKASTLGRRACATAIH